MISLQALAYAQTNATINAEILRLLVEAKLEEHKLKNLHGKVVINIIIHYHRRLGEDKKDSFYKYVRVINVILSTKHH